MKLSRAQSIVHRLLDSEPDEDFLTRERMKREDHEEPVEDEEPLDEEPALDEPGLDAPGAEGEAEDDELVGGPSATLSPEQAQLVKDNERLVYKIAHDFKNIIEPGAEANDGAEPNFSFDDIVSHAKSAMIRSARSYDPSYGVPFGAFAGRLIRQTLKKLFHRQGEYRQRNLLTLNAPTGGGDGDDEDFIQNAVSSAIDGTEEDGTSGLGGEDDVHTGVVRKETRDMLSSIIASLPSDNMRRAVAAFMNKGEGDTLRALADEMGMSHSGVQKLTQKGLRLIGDKLRSLGYNGYYPGLAALRHQTDESLFKQANTLLEEAPVDEDTLRRERALILQWLNRIPAEKLAKLKESLKRKR